jgi:hypothetical protein
MAADARPPAAPEDVVRKLEENLRAQLDGHRRLLACIESCREALRRADLETIGSACTEEHAITHELGELEKARLALVGSLTERLSPRAARPMALGQIAASLGGPGGTRLAAVAGDLRRVVEDVTRRSAVVRAAAESLSRHMAGIMQVVNGALGRARVYGRRGRLETGEQGQFCVDVRT